MVDVMLGLTDARAPLLESLRGPPYQLHTRLGVQQSLVENGVSVFGGNIPSLRSLALQSVAIPWDSRVYTGLTRLTIIKRSYASISSNP